MPASNDAKARHEGFALTDMLVGLTVLGLSLALSLFAGTQALKGAREAQRLDGARRDMTWRLNSQWQAALSSDGIVSGRGWEVRTERLEPAGGWAVCRITASSPPHRKAGLVTYRFCQPAP